ncbi:hypothetical protein RD792_004864 [Penstemon davidsonii]|uniref:Protein NO VEIN C-terminal domain-containing protein n=1 Tax=Penstemon davidsonii TaxID=160366 RepID=A0ABR0DJC5_9LAMI|nr:hypothetical protein RD792_004864 [Penstemon davidsonii]
MFGQQPYFRPCSGGRGAAPVTREQQQQQHIHQNSNFQNPNNLFYPHPNPNLLPQQVKRQIVTIEQLDNAAMKACHDLLSSNEYVSAWKVSQAVLLTVKAESWESLGFQMQQVPSLNRLLVKEGKISAFIHCFVAVRRISSLYDLEVEICEREGIRRYEELELGPLLRHPLVVQYFAVTSDVTEVYKIRTEEIISYLIEFMEIHTKKDVKVDTLMDFITKKQSVSRREKLCVRIQNLGIYINQVKQARQSEDIIMKKCFEKMRTKAVKRNKKRPLFSVQKKQLDDNFASISHRIKSFSSENTPFCGDVRFESSNSEDVDGEDDEDGEFRDTPVVVIRCNAKDELDQRKRRSENACSTTSAPLKRPKRNKFDSFLKHKGCSNQAINCLSLSIESLEMFITTWKEACQANNADEVLDRMLQFYNTKNKNNVKALFTSYPFVGLLNAAVSSIKYRMWDNMYDTFQAVGQQGVDCNTFQSSADYISIDVEPAKKGMATSAQKILKHKQDVTAEDIVKKMSEYFEDDILSYNHHSLENMCSLLRKLCKCQSWLIEQYNVNEFESLGYGDYFLFLEKYMHLLPHSLHQCLMGGIYENVPLEARLLPLQLEVLLSQALSTLSENEVINLQTVYELLSRQFPLVCFKLLKSRQMENFTDILREKSCNLTSNCVLFSSSLLRVTCKGDSLTQNEKNLEETGGFDDNIGPRAGMIDGVLTKDAIGVLLRAPMLTDLNLWSHWDLLFAPSLGSIVEWLFKEVNSKEFLCLVTKDGKVIRVDHSATTDSFLKVFIQGSAFETAVELLSLYALYGGDRNAPLSLLKCHARQAFEFFINNSLEMEVHDDKNLLMHQKLSSDQYIVGINTSSNLGSRLPSNQSILNKTVPLMSRFILDCLSYLPIEFCSFAADVLISGMQSFVKGVPSAILTECKKVEQRLILHEVGMSLGLVEWVNDYHSFCSSLSTGFPHNSLRMDVVTSKFNKGSVIVQNVLNKHPSSKLISSEADFNDVNCNRVCGGVVSAEVSGDVSASNSEHLPVLEIFNDIDPERVIEFIRQDEFGLHPGLSTTENSLLEKQHARLGRALHCLSQELYSQDSHFLLELATEITTSDVTFLKVLVVNVRIWWVRSETGREKVQNADDNIYTGNVEPTLTFILQEKGIIVLNNEKGFSANNIRALCDVGNSTKKGHSAGYIGKKGIGFKSVFRVTDVPEIHSNGFHIKFDITEGQIGFVLPTIVPPCDVDMYSRLASEAAAVRMDQNSWNTCIVLPFRSNLSESSGMNNIISMFSGLHPSLLLFLHRLQCIKLRNLLDDSFIVMRKEVIGDGIVHVALGNEKMTWFVVSQNLQADVIRSDVQKTEISIAFTLQETDDAGYTPILNQQPVFAFLPLRTYGFKFILQGDFDLPSSREDVDGNSPWNQWLLSEFPDLFVHAEKSFCDLPCYRGRPGKAVTTFMSFIPLVGEVRGYFSTLPRMIMSKLRMSNCLILEGDEIEWVPPCKVLRNWTEQTRSLIPDSLLHEHLGLGFLNKDIVLSDSLARALGVEDYGPTILLKIFSSLSRSENGLKSMGLSWLSSWLSAIYVMSSHSFLKTSPCFGSESDFMFNLKKTPFILLSNGKFGSVDEDTIWLHCDAVGQGIDEYVLKAFPELYAKLRIISPKLLAAAASTESSCSDITIVENVKRMLYKVGVQRLSAHEILKLHVLPAISDDKNATGQESLMVEYLSFAMFHLQSSCTICSLERDGIIVELREKALILTNYGYKRSNEVPIHFNREYENPVDVNKLISGLDVKWHEVAATYLKHPITKSLSNGVLKWRIFFQNIGVTDFVQIVQVKKRVADMPFVNIKDIIWGNNVISVESVAENWESEELFLLLSWISSRDDKKKSMYFMEILDSLWDSYFSDKLTGHFTDSTGEIKTFKSSLMSILQDVPWIVSNIDNTLHCPKNLFHDCVAVKSILGGSAPYTIPKVRNENLLADIGLKTQVTLDDALSVLRLWRISQSPFNDSVSQMSSFYGFLWKEMALSKNKIIEELQSGPFIFVPYTYSCSHEDVVPGALLSPREVYWHDNIGSIDQVKSFSHECVVGPFTPPIRYMLYNFYPDLHDFFVNECGVNETPPLRGYLQILLQLSTTALPNWAAKRVLEVFLRWADALKDGSLSLEDVEFIKESLLKKEYPVLPTTQDKWVSLHASFGLVCCCDDDYLGAEFKHLEGVNFLYFGESTNEESRMLHAKVITREAICYGLEDNSFIISLVNWILPYAQRYIYSIHPEKYFQLKQSAFEILSKLKIVVVEKLFYRNVIKRCMTPITSKKRYECNCLLQDNILYCSSQSDPHSIFLELSRLLYNGTRELHFANFLHMITTMAESGATEEQTEFFILNSQKVQKLPNPEESCWSLQSKVEKDPHQKFKRKAVINSNWSPFDWKTAPCFRSEANFESTEMSTEFIEGDQQSQNVFIPAGAAKPRFNLSSNTLFASNSDRVDEVFVQQAKLTGRLGELVAFKYLEGNSSNVSVKWVNEANETGLPYDITIESDENNSTSKEYIEVKATKVATKNWFLITMREWEFAIEKGESFSIAHVILADENMAKVSIYKNPARLCHLGNLKLAFVVPNES